jgi:hypothetical protein
MLPAQRMLTRLKHRQAQTIKVRLESNMRSSVRFIIISIDCADPNL